MDHHGIPRQALQWEPEGFRRRPGRPRENWESFRGTSGEWASAGSRLKRLRRTGRAGGIVSPNPSLTRDEPGASNQDYILCFDAEKVKPGILLLVGARKDMI